MEKRTKPNPWACNHEFKTFYQSKQSRTEKCIKCNSVRFILTSYPMRQYSNDVINLKPLLT